MMNYRGTSQSAACHAGAERSAKRDNCASTALQLQFVAFSVRDSFAWHDNSSSDIMVSTPIQNSVRAEQHLPLLSLVR
jgi:hypothetical protein